MLDKKAEFWSSFSRSVCFLQTRVSFCLSGSISQLLTCCEYLWLREVVQEVKFTHRKPKLNIREPLNYKDLYGNTTDLCKMVETNIVLSIKSTQPVFTCILCHLSAFQADSKRFRRVSVIRVSTVKCNERPNSVSAMPEAWNGINSLKLSLVSQFLHRIKEEMNTYPSSAFPTQLRPYHVC